MKEYRIKELFERNPNTWIPLPTILQFKIAQYGRYIKYLRDKLCMDIENHCDRTCTPPESFYRYNTYK